MAQIRSFCPKVIHLDITGKCNLSCIHCRGTYSTKDISYTQWKNLIDNISKYWKNQIKWIEIGGGEPFLRKDLFKIITYIKIAIPKSKILLVTNGTLIKDSDLKPIIKFVDRIQFSIDGQRDLLMIT